jgi:hypothetical protein
MQLGLVILKLRGNVVAVYGKASKIKRAEARAVLGLGIFSSTKRKAIRKYKYCDTIHT